MTWVGLVVQLIGRTLMTGTGIGDLATLRAAALHNTLLALREHQARHAVAVGSSAPTARSR